MKIEMTDSRVRKAFPRHRRPAGERGLPHARRFGEQIVQFRKWPLLALFSLLSINSFAGCPADFLPEKGSSVEKSRKLASIQVGSIDEPCLVAVLDRMANETDKNLVGQLFQMLDQWTGTHAFALSLFYRCAGLQACTSQKETGKRLVALFEKRNAPVDRLFIEYDRNGRPARADSLYEAVDRCAGLSVQQLLEWGGSREGRRDLAGAFSLYCRAARTDGQIMELCIGRISQALEEASRDSAAGPLNRFRTCLFSGPIADTTSAQLMLASLYNRYRLDEEEISTLLAFQGTSPQLAGRLTDIAAERFVSGRYTAVLAPAAAVYERAAARQARSAAAGLMYKAYQALRSPDSAIVWLRRSGLSAEAQRIDAAALYQAAGRLADAQAIIKDLPPSAGRDTLEIRQLLFRGDPAGAAELLQKGRLPHLLAIHDAALLWRVRTLLFAGRTDELGTLLDSVRLDPASVVAAEILTTRYRLQLYKSSGPALQIWSTMEFDCFRGNYAAIAALLRGPAVPAEFRTALSLPAIRAFLTTVNTAAAASLFTALGDTADSPEYLFLLAQTQIAQGTIRPAEETLLRCIRDFPGNVFSEKARVLLSRLRGRS